MQLRNHELLVISERSDISNDRLPPCSGTAVLPKCPYLVKVFRLAER